MSVLISHPKIRTDTEFPPFIQWSRLGSTKYLALPRDRVNRTINVPEQFVFDLLENSPRKWNTLTPQQRQHAVDYIEWIGGFR